MGWDGMVDGLREIVDMLNSQAGGVVKAQKFVGQQSGTGKTLNSCPANVQSHPGMVSSPPSACNNKGWLFLYRG